MLLKIATFIRPERYLINVKLSVFSVREMEYSYGIIEFDPSEEFLKSIAGRDPACLQREIEKKMNASFASFSFATGVLNYKGESLQLAYVRFELEDGSNFEVELYEKSARSFSNTGPQEHFDIASKFISALNPNVKLSGPRIIGFTW